MRAARRQGPAALAGELERSAPGARGPRCGCPRPGVLPMPRWCAPIWLARARMPAMPRWPAGTIGRVEAGAVILEPQAQTAVRPRSDEAHRRCGIGVLDHVVERLLGDAVERRLDVERCRGRRGRRSPPAIGQPDRGPGRRRRASGCACTRPSCSRLAGRSSKMSARISASASRSSSRSSPSIWPRRRRVALHQQLHAARREGHAEQRLGHRVVQLLGELGALLRRCQVGGLAPQVILEADLVAQVADDAVGAAEGCRRPRRPPHAARRGPACPSRPRR